MGRPRSLTRVMIARTATVALLVASMPLIVASPAAAARVKTIAISDASIVEGNAGQQNLGFTLTWTGSKGGAAPSVQYATAEGSATAGSDYTSSSGTATLTNGGCRCTTVNVPVKGDTTTEGTETFVVNLSNPTNATIGDAQATGTIYDNEGPPAIVVGDVGAPEADGSLPFTVQLTNASASTITVAYATADGTAVAGDDYTTTSGTLTFTPGDTSEPVAVTTADDDVAEDDETVALDLSSPTNASIADAQGLGSIVNDDADPSVSIGDVTVDENAGSGVASFTVMLDAASGRETAVDYATADGTAGNADYTAATGTITFPAGETSASLDVAIADDMLHEGDESFSVSLNGEVNLTLGTSTGTATITDDDPVPTIAADAVSATESDAAVTVTVSLSNPTTTEVSFDWATVDETATAGNDYVGANGSGTIPAGDASTTFEVTLSGDRVDEADETFSIALSNVVGATVGTGGAVTLTDDDKTPTALTVRVAKTRTAVRAVGLLEPAATGLSVTVTLAKKKGTGYVKVATKTVPVKGLKDRDGDGKTDGAYRAVFTRPGKGAYRFTVTFAGSTTLKKTSKAIRFRL